MQSRGMQGAQDDSTEVLIIVAAVVLMIISYLFNKNFDSIAEIWRWIRIVELYPFSYLPESTPLLGKLDIAGTIDYLKATPGSGLSQEFVSELDRYYGKHLSWIPAGVLGFLGWKLVQKTEDVSKTYDMETLLADRAQHYPFLEKFVDTNPAVLDLYFTRGSKESKDYSMALTPSLFATMTPPLGLEKSAKKNKLLRKGIWDGDRDFDHDLAERSFKAQLGRKYEGPSSLKPHEAKLYGILKKKIKCTSGEGFEILKKAVITAHNGKALLGITPVEKTLYALVKAEFDKSTKGKRPILPKECIKKPYLVKLYKNQEIGSLLNEVKAEQIMANHAFIRTGMMTLLEEARLSGVIPALEFRSWLKGQDRTLWYCMSTVGRRVSFVECAGCFAHWLVEKELQRPVPHIFVDEAVEGLYESLKIHEREKQAKHNNQSNKI